MKYLFGRSFIYKYSFNYIFNYRHYNKNLYTMSESISSLNVNKLEHLKQSEPSEPSEHSDINNKWISATKIKNFMMNDTLCDWLDMYYKSQDFHTSNKEEAGHSVLQIQPSARISAQTSAQSSVYTPAHPPAQTSAQTFTEYVMNQGIQFENDIFDILKTKFGSDLVTVQTDYNNCKDKAYFNKTISYMQEGAPIIYQGTLWNNKNKTYGIPDLIVRSDYINKIFKNKVLDNYKAEKGCKFSKTWHYNIIDIKYSTLNMACDGKHLLNNGMFPAYKGQLYLYNEALSNLQQYNSYTSYILGKKWNYVKNGDLFYGNNSFDKPGIINYSGYDALIPDKVKNGLLWMQKLKNDGHKWKINPPSVPELYPNMSSTYNTKWYTVKKELSEKIYEITDIWNCGIKHRQTAHNKNIFSWKDVNCNSSTLGHKGKKISPIIDSILNINRSDNIIQPAYIKSALPNALLNIFIDFETLNELTVDSSNTLFMIGIGWIDINTKSWVYKCIVSDKIDKENEIKIFVEMHNFINDLLEEYDAHNNYMLYHWSDAEKTIYSNLFKKVIEMPNLFNYSFDLYKLFLKEPITINGALDFSIKTIGHAMYKNGLIKTKWPDDISNGLNAMIKAKHANDYAIQHNIKLVDLEVVKNIINYNEADCKVLMEIFSYIQNNMIRNVEPITISNKTKNKRKASPQQETEQDTEQETEHNTPPETNNTINQKIEQETEHQNKCKKRRFV